MSIVTSNETLFQTAYGSAGSSLAFTALIDGSNHIETLRKQQIMHPTIDGLFLVASIRSGKYISLFNWAMSFDGFQIGSTNRDLVSKSPYLTLYSDNYISKDQDYQFLYIISPDSNPFSLQTNLGFRGIIPDAGETVFWFSEDFKFISLDYDYSGGVGIATWQGEEAAWQGDYVTW